jgi:hypothetical protein
VANPDWGSLTPITPTGSTWEVVPPHTNPTQANSNTENEITEPLVLFLYPVFFFFPLLLAFAAFFAYITPD